jgi:hypothetical protein
MFAANAGPAGASELSLTASPPANFAELDGPRDVMVDVYFGGRNLGAVRATTLPGTVRFQDPAEVARLLAPFADAPQVKQALQAALPSNAGKACSQMLGSNCGSLRPGVVGVIFDEDHFRVDIFLSDDLLGKPLTTDVYLSPTSQNFAAIGTLGAAMSGTTANDPLFNMQGRAVLSVGSSRLKSNVSYSSDFGVVVDDLLVEHEAQDRRYVGGLFWTPGTSLVGRRRILGVGSATQYDTQADRRQLEGTPLPVFVQQRSLVEILIDGRLVSSRVVEAGNELLDTSGLPEGSYPVVLRIREPGGGTREEHRFFVKDERLAPPGHIRFQAFAGLIAPTREGHPISASDTLFYQVGAAKRLTDNVGIEANLLGTPTKAIGEASVSLLTKHARVRVTGLASSSGEYGGVLQLGSVGSGRFQYNIDLRRVWDRDGEGLIPGSLGGVGFDSGSSVGLADRGGSYTQLIASLGYMLGNASLRLFASYNDTEHSKPDYSIGPSVDWLVAHGRDFQLRIETDAQKSRDTTSAYVGVKYLFSGSGFATSGSAGYRTQDNGQGRGKAMSVGSVNSEWSGSSEAFGHYSIGAGLDRAIDGTSARGRGSIDSRYGNLRADLLHNFASETQYSLSVQSGAAVGPRASVGGYNISESAMIVEVDGAQSAGRFEVLVDDAPMATVDAGKRATIFLQPYRRYAVRLRPLASASVHYDSGVRQVTLFPGNVDRQIWKAVQTFTVFGQLVDSNGLPITNGLLHGDHGAGSSDANGYFQIDVAANDRVTLDGAHGQACQLMLGKLEPRKGYSAAGKVVCR